MTFEIRTERKSSSAYNEDPRSRAIDELIRISAAVRDEALGEDWAEQSRKFYYLEGMLSKAPSFRPSVQIPQLQILSINEAVDLTDSSPKVYIYDKQSGKVDDQRSRSFQQQWKESWVNYELMFAALWAQFVGIGYLQLGYDPFGDQGFGKLWACNRAPDTLYWDSGATHPGDATYCAAVDRLYPDQIAYAWPETGRGIEAEPINPGFEGARNLNALPSKMRMPPGPMRQFGSPTAGENVESDGRLSVRYLFIEDRTVELVREQAGGDSAAIVERLGTRDSGGRPTKRLKYPNKRLIVDVSGRGSRVVADGDNPTPGNRYPFVPIYGLPALKGFYPPPPTRYTKDLQFVAERIITQIFENVVRTNNGIWFIDQNTGINPDAFGGLPGEVQMISADSRPPTFVTPNAVSGDTMKLAQFMLSTQKELQGYNQTREGQPGAGNISADLFEASMYQSKQLTRCRARMLAKSVHSLATLMYDLMGTYFTQDRSFATEEGGFSTVTWKPYFGIGAKNNKLHIDPTSLMPISQSAMRQMAPMLRQEGAIDVQTLLESLQVPDAAGIAERLSREQALTALNKLKHR